MATGGTERGLHLPHIPTPDLRGAARWLGYHKGRLILAGVGLGGVGIATFELLTNHNPPTLDQTSKPGAAEPAKPAEPGQAVILPQLPQSPDNSQVSPTASPTTEANTTPEKEVEAKCSFFEDPKFCELAEVFQMTTRSGLTKGVGIKKPSDPTTEIRIVSPFDGYLSPSLSNPHGATISTDRHTLNGFILSGNFKFIPLIRADGIPVKKGDLIAILIDEGYQPLPQSEDYIAYLLPQNTDASGKFSYPEKSIEEHFPTAYAKLPKELTYQPSPTTYEQGGVIVVGTQ